MYDERTNPSNLRSTSWAGIEQEERYKEQQRQKAELIAELKIRLDSYRLRLLQDWHIQKLPRLSRRAHWNFFDAIYSSNTLGEAAREHLNAADDFVTTRPGNLHDPIEWFIYEKGSVWQDMFLRLFQRKKKREGSSFSGHIPTGRIEIPVTIFFVLVANLVQLLPIGILYLAEWIKGVYALSVVLVAGVVFTLLLRSVANYGIAKLLVYSSAYMAVLVAFLANVKE